MPSKKQYNLVQNDEYDTRIPLHPEEAFHHGISFQAKYIGTLDVPRPTSRVEIVAAMRRIRYEFKAKGIKKKKVTVDVSVDGVRVSLRKKKKKKQWLDDNNLLLMHHPIYRIFYVSHDSQDLKIFSYIARDSSSDLFKCNVFKSNKKSQAMRIVRTVGQAFEVCHKLSAGAPEAAGATERDGDGDEEESTERGPLDGEDVAGSERGSDSQNHDRPRKDTLSDPISCDTLPVEDASSLLDTSTDLQAPGPPGPGGSMQASGNSQRPLRLDILPPPPASTSSSRRSPLGCGAGGETYTSPLGEPLRHTPAEALPSAGTPLSAHHELQLLREQLEQQVQQTQAAVAQVHLLRDQLAAETAARLEAQARTHQLLVHNKELLDHISVLVAHLQDQERQLTSTQNASQQQQQLQQQQQQRLIQQSLSHPATHVVTSVPQMPTTTILCDAQTPTSASVYLPPELGAADLDILTRGSLIENRATTAAAASRPPSIYDQLFQQQLLQALGAYRPTYYAPPPLYAAAPPGYRVSQASSYASSPVLPRSAVASSAAAAVAAAAAAAAAASMAPEPDPPPDPPVVQHPRSPQPQHKPAPLEATFIKPLPHTVIVPCPASDEPSPTSRRQQGMSTLKVSGDSGGRGGRLLNGPPLISRSTSEKVPHRSELMSQVQRTAWARHTTK